MNLRPRGTLMQPKQVRSAARVTPTCSHRAACGTIKKALEAKVVPELSRRKEVLVVGEHLRRLALQPVVVPRLRHPKGASLATTARSPGSSWNPLENLGNSCTFSVGDPHTKNVANRSTFYAFVTFGGSKM